MTNSSATLNKRALFKRFIINLFIICAVFSYIEVSDHVNAYREFIQIFIVHSVVYISPFIGLGVGYYFGSKLHGMWDNKVAALTMALLTFYATYTTIDIAAKQIPGVGWRLIMLEYHGTYSPDIGDLKL